MQRVGIIGAGPAGLAAAYELIQSGQMEVTVLEASPFVGGLCRSFEMGGHIVDLGPHRYFSNDRKINEFWLKIAQGRYHMVDRTTRIFYRQKFFSYPLEAKNALLNMGIGEAVLCVLSYLKRTLFPYKPENNFARWVSNRFGDRLYKIFFKSYSEKLWGIPCEQLDMEFAKQRIKKFSLGEAIKKILLPSGKQHRTLVDEFAYPHRGTGSFYEELAKTIEKAGGKIHAQNPVQKLTRANNTWKVQTPKMEYEFDLVVSTMPLTKLVSALGKPKEVRSAAEKLRFRSTILVYLHLDQKDLFHDQWLYFQSEETKCGRVTNFNNWNLEQNQKAEGTILSVEYWCQEGDEFWNISDEKLISLADAELRSSGLIIKSKLIQGKVVRIPASYPIFEIGFRDHLETVVNAVKDEPNLWAIGRNGSFKYNNQDHSLLMGILVSENILQGENHDLWQVNSDTEYQEQALITKSGLVSV